MGTEPISPSPRSIVMAIKGSTTEGIQGFTNFWGKSDVTRKLSMVEELQNRGYVGSVLSLK